MKFQSLKISKSLLLYALPAVLSVTACTKKRDATFSETEAEQVFAISDFGNIEQDKAEFSLKTSSRVLENDGVSQFKAYSEKGLVEVESAKVPERLRFMFDGLEVTGQKESEMPIVFTVDRRHVTAWKEVTGLDELSTLEKQYAKSRQEVVLSQKIQKTRSAAEREKLASEIKKLTLSKGQNTTAKYLVPIFKYEVIGKGIVQRVKNDLKEETSNLQLKETDWDQATHIKLSPRKDSLNPVGLDVSDKQQLDRTFSVKSINGKVMRMEELRTNFKVKADLRDDAVVMTSVDDDGLNIFEITEKSKLSETELQLLKTGSARGRIEECSADLRTKLGKSPTDDCVTIYRFVVPVAFVRVQLPPADRFGSEGAVARIETVPYTDSVGLVHIPEMAEPRRVTADEVYDSSTVLRVADIKNAEFFFRRTLADAPVSTTFMPGEASELLIVKFDLEDQRLVVRRADKIIEFKTGSNDNDIEDLMTIPVRYLRREVADSRGTPYAFPRWVKTNKENAEYIAMSWTDNMLPATHSPVAYYGGGGCLAGVADQVVSNVDMRMNEGVLNFTFSYKAALAPTEACVGIYSAANDYNPGGLPAQLTARLQERISFLKKDTTKHQNHQDQSFVPSVPFPAQNMMGYGVWTIGKFDPTKEGGSYSREGQQLDIPVVQDFRNGRKLVYTVTNLPTDDLKRRELYKETIKEIIQAWNDAYSKAFKGVKGFERNGNYIEVQFEGDAGVTGHLGDLDKNIIHFENKINDNHGVLGVSQVGFNNRSGIVVADSLIIYAGNLSKFVEGARRGLKNLNQYQEEVISLEKEAVAQLEKTEAAKVAPAGAASDAQEGAAKLAKFTKSLKSSLAKIEGEKRQVKSVDINSSLRRVNIVKSQVAKIVADRKALGGIGAFKFAPANMETAWVEKALRRSIEKADTGMLDVEGILAEEMLNSMGNKMSEHNRNVLKNRVAAMKVRDQIRAKIAKQNGCVLEFSGRESLNFSYAGADFNQALKRALYFDLGHEMGHSQGLTHNFIASYDKANWKKDSSGNTITNYSSIMDYIEPANLQWGGIGEYDSHALRAAHTGLIEINQDSEALATVKSKFANLVDGKYVHVEEVKKLKNSWINLTKYDVMGLLKPYKYCTDIHVGYEPTCQRFDVGGSAEEIVDNLIADYKENHVAAYHAWDRLNFDLRSKSYAVGSTMRTMISLRQYFDELMYTLAVNRDKPQDEIQDYFKASLKAYLFLTSVVYTPDQTAGVREDFPFQLDVAANKDQSGKVTPIVFERKSLADQAMSPDRLSTIGIENDKVLAIQLLTLKGLPYFKYWNSNVEFSFLDFEKYFLGMDTPDKSIAVNTLMSILANEQRPMILSKEGGFVPVQGENTISPTMRAYAAINSVLGLEANALRDKDNFANLFKVGTTIGKGPEDRLSLSQLGVKSTSAAKVMFWALDNAAVAQGLLEGAAELNNFLQVSDKLSPIMQQMSAAQLQISLIESLKGNKATEADKKMIADSKAKLKTATDTLVAEIKAAKLISDELAAQNPQLSAEGQAQLINEVNKQIITGALTALLVPASAEDVITDLKGQLQEIGKTLPLVDFAQEATSTVVANFAKQFEGKKTPLADIGQVVGQIASGGQTEFKYGLQMKNIEFLSKLTMMTNPEYAR